MHISVNYTDDMSLTKVFYKMAKKIVILAQSVTTTIHVLDTTFQVKQSWSMLAKAMSTTCCRGSPCLSNDNSSEDICLGHRLVLLFSN